MGPEEVLMSGIELHQTILGFIESVREASNAGLVVTEADLLIPLEVSAAIRHGKPVLYAAPPHSRWKSGVLPTVHKSRIHIVLEEREATPAKEETGAE
jgi:hypothetical protein